MENSSNQRGVGGRLREDVHDVRGIARTAGGDDWHAHNARHGPRQLDVVPRARSVAIDAREENLAGAERYAARRPLDGVKTCWPSAAE